MFFFVCLLVQEVVTPLPPTLIRLFVSLLLRLHTLQLIHFYTCGADEVKCWTIRKGWKAPQAAGTIHTDFERGFIKAEGYSYADWKSLGGVDKVKEAGKYRTEGKEYVVNDGDIIFFKFNVTAEGKKK